MAILARLTNFCYVKDFGKDLATAFVGISKVPMVKVEIHSFSIYRVSHKKVSIKNFQSELLKVSIHSF